MEWVAKKKKTLRMANWWWNDTEKKHCHLIFMRVLVNICNENLTSLRVKYIHALFVWYELIYSLWQMYKMHIISNRRACRHIYHYSHIYLEIKRNCGTKLILRITNVNAWSPVHGFIFCSNIIIIIIISFSDFFSCWNFINWFAIVSMVHILFNRINNIFESMLLNITSKNTPWSTLYHSCTDNVWRVFFWWIDKVV